MEMMHAETASVSHCSRLQPKISHSQFQATSWSESHSLGTRDRKDANITAWYQDVSVRHGSATQTMEMSRSFNAIFMSFISDAFDVMRAMGYYHHSAVPLAWIHPGERAVWVPRGLPVLIPMHPTGSSQAIPCPSPIFLGSLNSERWISPGCLSKTRLNTSHSSCLGSCQHQKLIDPPTPTQAQLCQTYFWFVLSLMHWHCAMFVGSFHWWNWARWWSTGAIAF